MSYETFMQWFQRIVQKNTNSISWQFPPIENTMHGTKWKKLKKNLCPSRQVSIEKLTGEYHPANPKKIKLNIARRFLSNLNI